MPASSVVRSPLAIVLATLAVLTLVGASVFFIASWHAKSRAQLQSLSGQFAWLTKALEDCEAEAGMYPSSLYFMVVPLAPVGNAGNEIQAKAMDRVGSVALLDSAAAMEGLEKGSLRMSREQFLLHVRDAPTNTEHRWNSVSGVSTLSERRTSSTGPFQIRLQTSPDDPLSWSTVTAEGVGTCHWVFALFRR